MNFVLINDPFTKTGSGQTPVKLNEIRPCFKYRCADFGLSKSFGAGGEWIVQQEGGPELPPPRQSNDVVTEGYVPPELLLGAQSYGPEVDIWVSSGTRGT